MNFLLSEILSEDKTEEYRKSIEKIGGKCVSLKDKPFETIDLYSIFPKDSCVVTFGTLNLVRDLQHNTNWVPGAWCNFQNFKCSTYYAYWHKYMWNRNGWFQPWGQIRDDYDGETFFIRPDDGFKSFTGQVIKGDYDIRYIDSLVKPETLCLVDHLRKPCIEWRLFCSRDEVITGSKYKSNMRLDVSDRLDRDVIDYVNRILKEVEWYPDNLFVVDVGMNLDGEYFVIELNSFSCSGVYASDIDKIIQTATKQAEIEWKEIYE